MRYNDIKYLKKYLKVLEKGKYTYRELEEDYMQYGICEYAKVHLTYRSRDLVMNHIESKVGKVRYVCLPPYTIHKGGFKIKSEDQSERIELLREVIEILKKEYNKMSLWQRLRYWL